MLLQRSNGKSYALPCRGVFLRVSLLMLHRETLYEDDKFPKQQLAALVASKVYYHLGDMEDSMMFALGAGDLFDIDGKSEYIDTIICEMRQ